MATVGLGAFAIVLALVEQVLPLLPHARAREARGFGMMPVFWAHLTSSTMMWPKPAGAGGGMQIVLEILTENVSRGSEVYEKGHVLVLAWAVTQRDREVIWKILSQVPATSSCACSRSRDDLDGEPLGGHAIAGFGCQSDAVSSLTLLTCSAREVSSRSAVHMLPSRQSCWQSADVLALWVRSAVPGIPERSRPRDCGAQPGVALAANITSACQQQITYFCA